MGELWCEKTGERERPRLCWSWLPLNANSFIKKWPRLLFLPVVCVCVCVCVCVYVCCCTTTHESWSGSFLFFATRTRSGCCKYWTLLIWRGAFHGGGGLCIEGLGGELISPILHLYRMFCYGAEREIKRDPITRWRRIQSESRGFMSRLWNPAVVLVGNTHVFEVSPRSLAYNARTSNMSGEIGRNSHHRWRRSLQRTKLMQILLLLPKSLFDFCSAHAAEY